MSYQELSVEERITIQLGQLQGLSQRAIAKMLDRCPSTISRELRRNSCQASHYRASQAQQHMRQRRTASLLPGSELFDLVAHLLRKRFSPQQTAGKLLDMEFPNVEDVYVCRERIYNAIYALPVGELRKALIICLRQGKTTQRPRTGGVDRRGQIPDLVSIHVRPAEVEDRFTPGHWEGDLIKGKANASALETLVEPRTGYLMLVKMNDATATSVVEGFSAALNRMPLAGRKKLIYDQGREMVRHAENTQRTGVDVYFCDPHTPCQRGSNENINGLIRQYLPKGTDLSGHSQEQLDAIAYELNIRPRQRFNYKCPIEMMTAMMAKHHESPSLTQRQGVALSL